jgi:type VI secretion system protein ImpH
MATPSRGADPSLTQVLFEEGYRFDFFQAVRLLERLYSDRRPVGREAKPREEVVRFHADLSLSFPPSAIHELTTAAGADDPARMTVSFMGLTGPLGVLPRHYTELLMARVRQKDQTLRDFLDLFNHRLISLFYRAWEKYRFPIAYERSILRHEGLDYFTQCLFDLIGMGTKGLHSRLRFDDELLLFYAGLLAQHPKTAVALEGLLTDYFEVPVRVGQFLGQWLPLMPENRSRLGLWGTHHCLGGDAVAGERVWDQQAKFRVHVGPLTYGQFLRFLPMGSAFQTLVEVSRFFAGQECDFDVQLLLKAAEVPFCRLGGVGDEASRLGWSTWLKVGEFTHDATDVVLAGEQRHGSIAGGEIPSVEGEGQHECELEIAHRQAE